MCRDDLTHHGEIEIVNHVIAELSQRLFPQEKIDDIDQTADRLIASIFGERRT
jgi:hypothetical protein